MLSVAYSRVGCNACYAHAAVVSLLTVCQVMLVVVVLSLIVLLVYV